jgi:hypothetical protein
VQHEQEKREQEHKRAEEERERAERATFEDARAATGSPNLRVGIQAKTQQSQRYLTSPAELVFHGPKLKFVWIAKK